MPSHVSLGTHHGILVWGSAGAVGVCRQCLCAVPGLWAHWGCRGVLGWLLSLGCWCGGCVFLGKTDQEGTLDLVATLGMYPSLSGGGWRLRALLMGQSGKGDLLWVFATGHLSMGGRGFLQAACSEILEQSHRNRGPRELVDTKGSLPSGFKMMQPDEQEIGWKEQYTYVSKKGIQFLHTQEMEAGSEQKRDRSASTMLFDSLISLLLSWHRTDRWIVPSAPSSCGALVKSFQCCIVLKCQCYNRRGWDHFARSG